MLADSGIQEEALIRRMRVLCFFYVAVSNGVPPDIEAKMLGHWSGATSRLILPNALEHLSLVNFAKVTKNRHCNDLLHMLLWLFFFSEHG